MKNKNKLSDVLFYLTSLTICLITDVHAIDWDKVPAKKITLFLPGQASWEWLLTDHEGAAKIRSGSFCRDCHEGNEAEMGATILGKSENSQVSERLESSSLLLSVKTAIEKNVLFVQLTWPSTASTPPKTDAFETMAAIMLDDGQVPEIRRGGCWGACHDDAKEMASENNGQPIGKYLVKSRKKMTRKGGGDAVKTVDELAELLSSGYFAEIWQARLKRDQTPLTKSGYILSSRSDHQVSQVSTKAQFANNTWVVEFARPLSVKGKGYKEIGVDKTYTVGFAIHQSYMTGRWHFVSFGHTLRLQDGTADLIAQ